MATTATAIRILRKPEVAKRTGLSTVTLWRLERRGDFPRSVQLSPGSVGYVEHEVDEWLNARVQSGRVVRAGA